LSAQKSFTALPARVIGRDWAIDLIEAVVPARATDLEAAIVRAAVIGPELVSRMAAAAPAAGIDPVGIDRASAGLMVATGQDGRIVLEVVIDLEVAIAPAATDQAVIGQALEIVPVLAGLAIGPAMVIGPESPGPGTDHRIGTTIDRLFDRVGRMDVGTMVVGGVGTTGGTAVGTVGAGPLMFGRRCG
jgi:hypothetical protein